MPSAPLETEVMHGFQVEFCHSFTMGDSLDQWSSGVGGIRITWRICWAHPYSFLVSRLGGLVICTSNMFPGDRYWCCWSREQTLRTTANIPNESRNHLRWNRTPPGRRPLLCGHLTVLKSRDSGCAQSMPAGAPTITWSPPRWPDILMSVEDYLQPTADVTTELYQPCGLLACSFFYL